MRWIALAALVTACWRGDAPAVAPPVVEPRLEVAAFTESDANAVIGRMAPRDRARLQELWYMYDLQDVIGDEDNAERLMKRLEKEFATPIALDPEVVREALGRSRKILANVLTSHLGPYQKSDRVAQPILEIILKPDELEKRMLAFPNDVIAAWFVVQYYADAHYHNYRMHNRMFELLGKHGGRRGLNVIADRIRTAVGESDDGMIRSADWERSVSAARKILGRDFKSWYGKALGRDFNVDRQSASVPREIEE